MEYVIGGAYHSTSYRQDRQPTTHVGVYMVIMTVEKPCTRCILIGGW